MEALGTEEDALPDVVADALGWLLLGVDVGALTEGVATLAVEIPGLGHAGTKPCVRLIPRSVQKNWPR